jgi:hypothetical protein
MTFTRKTIAGFAVFGALAVPGIALAATSSADANGYCVSSAKGCASSINAPGSGAGAFGAFGPGNNWAGGANGPATGAANSSLAGNNPVNGITQETPRDNPANTP